MKRATALFVTRRALEAGRSSEGLSRMVTGWLRDHAATGSVVFIVTGELQLGERHFDSRTEMLAALRHSERHTLPIADVIVLDNAFDPAPFWDAARRFNLALQASLFVSERGELSGAARSAGVARAEASAAVGIAA